MNQRIHHLQEINKAWTQYANDRKDWNKFILIEKLEAYRRWRESDYFKIPEIPAEVPTR